MTELGEGFGDGDCPSCWCMLHLRPGDYGGNFGGLSEDG